MRIAILSDIHGNYDALKTVLNSIPSVDYLIVAGDVLGYYPFFNSCIEELDKADALTIAGNHEYHQLNVISRPNHPIIEWFCRYFEKEANPKTKKWLRELEETEKLKLNFRELIMFHGSPWSNTEYIWPNSRQWKRFNRVDGDIIVLGHTHHAMDVHWSHKRIVNPGAVGQARDGDPKAKYAIYDDNNDQLEFYEAEYDTRRLIEAMLDLGHTEEFFKHLLISKKGNIKENKKKGDEPKI